MLAGNMPSGFGKMQRMQQGGHGRPCRLNEEDVKALLKENLVIFKNAEVKTIQKVGFERQNGIIL